MYCSNPRRPMTYSGGSMQMPISSRSSWPSIATPWTPDPTWQRRMVPSSAMRRNSSLLCLTGHLRNEPFPVAIRMDDIDPVLDAARPLATRCLRRLGAVQVFEALQPVGLRCRIIRVGRLHAVDRPPASGPDIAKRIGLTGKGVVALKLPGHGNSPPPAAHQRLPPCQGPSSGSPSSAHHRVSCGASPPPVCIIVSPPP